MRKIFLFIVTAVAILHVAYGQNRELQIFRGGSLVQSFNVATLDSVKVGYSLNAPVTVNAKLDGKSIAVSWTAVQGAVSYQVYRSSDANTAYKLLASDITGTGYKDSAPLDGANYYKVKAVGPGMQSQLSPTSAFIMFEDDSELLPGLYMGIMGFNDDVIDKGDMSLLAPNTKSGFTTFVNSLTTKKATVLYYAVDQALDKLTSTPFPRNLTQVSIVTFTDGLDQGSLPMVDYKYSTREEYRTYLGNRIKSAEVQGLPLSAFSIGLRGGDVTNDEEFKKNLESLASTDTNAVEATDMSAVDVRFQEIANQLIKTTETRSLSIKFPKMDDGMTFRFTFDNVSDAAKSKVYIEGTMNARENTFNNVKYVGLTCKSGTHIQGTPSGKTKVVFDFEDVKMSDGTNVTLNYINEYFLEGSYWQVNSEFDNDEDLQVNVTRSSAAIMLVLDCSSSLQKDGDKFTEMKTHVKSFIEKLANAMEDVHLVTGITLSKSTLTVNPGTTAQLTATVSPTNASNKTVSWSSSNTNVATVNHNGVVTAVSEGSCTITAKAKDGSGKSASCTITVPKLVNNITLNYSTLNINTNTTAQIVATVSPTNASNKSVSWSSSNTNVATVNNNGVVTAVSVGTCTITVFAMDGSGKKATCTITVFKDKSGTIDGYDYVDLGLPSGTLWATCNVGASKPEGYGNYYAWGETATKTVYDWSTYKWTSGSSSTPTKYTGSSSAELQLSDDAAYVNWGKNWRMPSQAQFEELINSNYTTTTWTSINGIYGRKITSKMPGYTGNSIFLPAAGYYYGSSLNSAGSDGNYWSRTLSVSSTIYAMYLYFNSSNIGTSNDYRYYGQSIRPVRFSE